MALNKIFIYQLCILIISRTSSAVWLCQNDVDCSDTEGAVCNSRGECACPDGQETVLGGTRCVDVAVYYHLSSCSEDFQCFRLVSGYSCNRNGDQGFCDCAPGHHFFRGRCWPSREYGEACSRDEECQSVLRNPFNMQCSEGFCTCAQGYYLRQRGECRKSGYGVGDACVLDVDCQFENGVCDHGSFTCYNSLEGPPQQRGANFTVQAVTAAALSRSDGALCDVNSPCATPFVCTARGVCACPVEYFPNEEGTDCMAHLGSPSAADQCVGLFKELQDGVCTCQANFFYDDNMRDCVKASLRISDSCLSDAMCHTFGVGGYCGPETEPWGIRSCQCDPEISVRNEAMSICLLFRGLGEECESDDECYAGELAISCSDDGSGTSRCTCPDHLTPQDGLCLQTDLALGDSCQVSAECSAVEHAACVDSVCVCEGSFLQIEDICSPQIGGDCEQDNDCFINNTVCASSTCQCANGFVTFEDECLQVSDGYNSTCIEDIQCRSSMGEGGVCIENACFCNENYHYLNERCWESIGLFGECSRRSDCFLGDLTERVVCRNSLCQCDFDYVYLEDENTCHDGATSIVVNIRAICVLLFTLYTMRRFN